MRADDHGVEVTQPRSASDLLREAGYDMPDSRRRRRRDRTEEPPPVPERTMFPYRRETSRETSVDRAAAERTDPALPPQRPQPPARSQLVRQDPARQQRPEPPRSAPVRPLPPRADLQQTDLRRTDLPRTDLPRTDLPRTDLPRAQPPMVERSRSERTMPPFGEPSRPAARWAPDRTGPQTEPQTGPQTWPPLAAPLPARRPVHPGYDQPTQLAPVQHLPTRRPPVERAPVERAAGRLPAAAPGPAVAPARHAPPPKRAVPPEYDDRPLDRRRTRAVPEPVDDHDEHDDAPDRSLLREWVMFFVETLLAAATGLGLWLGFHTLWRLQPMLAAAGSGVVLVGLHVIAGWIRRRQTGGELDLFTSAVVTAVGVAITVLPAAFAISPG